MANNAMKLERRETRDIASGTAILVARLGFGPSHALDLYGKKGILMYFYYFYIQNNMKCV
jgi:hypothetical protein